MKTNQPIEIVLSERDRTATHETVEVEGRMKAPVVPQGISLSGERKVIDYGHVCSLMQQKYGKIRGEAAYMAMIDNPSANRGLHFLVGQKIQREKIAMMMTLDKFGDPDNHHYQGLYQLYMNRDAGKKCA